MKSIRVIYGTEIDNVVDGNTDPKDIMDTLTRFHKELADAEYNIVDVGDVREMRITLKRGNKAAVIA